jgi:CRAL/TRIO domain
MSAIFQSIRSSFSAKGNEISAWLASSPDTESPDGTRTTRPSILNLALRSFSGGNKTHADEVEATDSSTSQKLLDMMLLLSPEEMEMAARSSYSYLVTARNNNNNNKDGSTTAAVPPATEDTKIHAKQMAQRYLESKKGNVEGALEKLKATLKFRQETEIENLICCFDDNTQPPPAKQNNQPNQNSPCDESLSSRLQARLESKHLYVQGYDKDGRSTFVFCTPKVPPHDVEWTLKEALYTMERAIACSKALDGTINAVVDFKGFRPLTHAPPLEIGKQFLLALRNHYAGQMHKIFLVDAPTSFRWVWNMFQGFVGTKTRDKIVFVSGERSKRTIISEHYDASEAPSWLLPEGTLNGEFNVERYLWKIPFDEPYDGAI